jgi:hypothetical protein
MAKTKYNSFFADVLLADFEIVELHKKLKKLIEDNKMRTITKSVIKLSEIPEELHQYIIAGFDVHTGHNVHSYLEVHIGDEEDDPLTLWLIEKYPTLSRKISFLIHIDK